MLRPGSAPLRLPPEPPLPRPDSSPANQFENPRALARDPVLRHRAPHAFRESHQRRTSARIRRAHGRRGRGAARASRQRLGRLARRGISGPRHRGARCRTAAARRPRRARPHGHARDGQAHRAGRGRDREMRRDLRVDGRARRAAAHPGGGRHGRRAQLRALRGARRRAGGDALELPVVAGDPGRRPGAHGGQRPRAQACEQRQRRRARAPAVVAGRRCPGRRVHDATGALRRCPGSHRPRGDRGDHAHRQ